MSSQSPQRSRKQAQQSGVIVPPIPLGPSQPTIRREPSPSPSLREHQRYNRTMSMPIVTPLSQIQGATSAQQAQLQKHQQGSSPSQEAQYTIPQGQGAFDEHNHKFDTETPVHPTPQHSQSYSQPSPSQLQHNQNQSNNPFYTTRPARAQTTQFGLVADGDEEWEFNDRFIAQIQRADILMHHQQQLQAGIPPAPGTEGVAYAGGAVSAIHGHFVSGSPPKGSDKIHAPVKDGDSAHISGGSSGRRQTVTQIQVTTQTQSQGPAAHASQGREWDRGRDTVGGVSAVGSTNISAQGRSQRSSSRPLTPDNTKNASTSTYYGQAKAPTPPGVSRKTANTSPTYPAMSSPMRAVKNRTPDRSLPVQEEPDDHENVNVPGNMQHTGVSPIPPTELGQGDREWDRSSKVSTGDNAGFDDHDDNEGTLIEQSDEIRRQSSSGGDETEEATHTPRSPTAVVFEDTHSQPKVGMRSIHEVLQDESMERPQMGHARNGSFSSQATASQPFNPSAFEDTMKKLQNPSDANIANGNAERNIRQIYPQQPLYSRNESRGSYPNWIPDFYQSYQDDYEQFGDNLYVPQAEHQNGHYRPHAPEPSSAHSQTTAPLPLHPNSNGPHEPIPRTLIPPFSPGPPGGTPYPYPFSHLRRYAYQSHPSAPRVTSSLYDPSMVQEQLEQIRLQMQMYALNNGAITDSTFSPASTPYPGAAPMYSTFNAYWNQTRNNGRGVSAMGDHPDNGGRITSASIRSSPSHMPVSLPLPPMRGRGLKKRERFSNLRGTGTNTRRRVQPPPRVESTQPRDTSPEPSSGEETAGDKFDISPAVAGQEWNNGAAHVEDENGEWIDEDSDEERDLLDLEFHPTYVSNMVRRRRRWDDRWEQLVRAFQALDRETDTTLILLAAPSHTNTLHSLTSRAIRRDASLFDAPAMTSVRDYFGQLAAQRRSARTQRPSLVERLVSSSSGGEHSPSSTASREEDLRRALKTALESLNEMRKMNEQREFRWREEQNRLLEERDVLENLMRQTLGSGFAKPPGGPSE